MVSATECHISSSWDRVNSPFFSTSLQLMLLGDWLLAAFPSSYAQQRQLRDTNQQVLGFNQKGSELGWGERNTANIKGY